MFCYFVQASFRFCKSAEHAMACNPIRFPFSLIRKFGVLDSGLPFQLIRLSIYHAKIDAQKRFPTRDTFFGEYPLNSYNSILNTAWYWCYSLLHIKGYFCQTEKTHIKTCSKCISTYLLSWSKYKTKIQVKNTTGCTGKFIKC